MRKRIRTVMVWVVVVAPAIVIAQDQPKTQRSRLYHEALRPQFHFTARYWDDHRLQPGPHQEGWINDVNGLVYSHGEYHFFAQRWWSCWLHAVSKDLIHWVELPPAFGKGGAFGGTQSGGAVVDPNNRSGLADGREPVMVAFWSSTDNLNQCISYSQDQGRTWVKYSKNPVLTHPYRDPAVFWYEPTQQWIMILYGPMPGTGNVGNYGFNGESNDAHDLLEYEIGKWKCSVIRLYDNGRVDVSDQSGHAEKMIDIHRQNISADAFYVGAKTGVAEYLEGDIAEILAYDRTLTEDETRRVILHLQSKGGLDSTNSTAVPTSGLVLHLEATQSQADDSGRIAVWNDTSGLGHDMTQTDPDRMPRRVEKALGNRPALHFGGAQFLKGPAVLAGGDDSFTIVALWRRDHLGVSETICEQNSPTIQTGRRASLLAEGVARSHQNCFLLFSSTNLLQWKKLDTFVPNMFECPDMFPLGLDGNRQNQKWIVVDGNGDYVVGKFDGRRFERETSKITGNYGRNFYATRTFTGMPEDDNRRIQMAWMRGGEYPNMPFNQQITFPCELSLRSLPDGIRMCSYPIREIQKLYDREFILNNRFLKPGENPLSKIRGGLFDIEVEIDVSKSTCERIVLNLLGSLVEYDLKRRQLESCGSKATLNPKSGQIHLRILVDRMSVETFGNRGEVCMTNVSRAREADPPLSLYALGGIASIKFLALRNLKSIWQ